MTRCNDNADKANRAQDEALKYIDELADARVELKELHSEAEMRNRTLVQNQNKIIKLKTKFSEVEKKLQDKEAELKLAEASALDFHDRMGHLHSKLTPNQLAWCDATGFYDPEFHPERGFFFPDESEPDKWLVQRPPPPGFMSQDRPEEKSDTPESPRESPN